MMVSSPSCFAAATRSPVESAEAVPAEAPIAKTENAASVHLPNLARFIPSLLPDPSLRSREDIRALLQFD
jgi:hypothetical protein